MAGVKQFDEELALRKALALFWQQGYGATSMPDLAETMGVLRGSLYNAYGGKEGIFLRAFERYSTQMLRDIEAALAHKDVRKALKRFFEFTINSMTTGTPTRGCLTTKTAFDEGRDSDVVRRELQGLLNTMEAMLAQRLDLPDAQEVLALDSREAARLIVTFTRGVVVIERVYGDKARLRRTAANLVALLLAES